MSDDKPFSYYQNDPQIYKLGVFAKQGGRIKTWKTRTFVLDRKNKILRYFKHKQEEYILKGSINLEGYSIADAEETIKKQYSLMITKDGARTYFMVAEEAATKADWLYEIQETLKKQSSKRSNSAEKLGNLTDEDDDGNSDEEDFTLRRSGAQSKEDVTLVYREEGDEDVTLWRPSMPMAREAADATLIPLPRSNHNGYDPNATLIGSGGGYDSNATLVGGGGDMNATLVGDDNATLVGDGFGLVNNSAKLRAMGQPMLIPRVKLVPFNSYFPIIERDVLRTIKFGRKKEDAGNDPDFIGFDSKVISRRHAEIWAVNEDFYIRDTKSQSGTFLNAMRLSLPGEESKPFKLKNGDTIQLGVDYRGSIDNSTKCVSVTVELALIKNDGRQPY